jgi:cell wall-associated NlpC family hydrolase
VGYCQLPPGAWAQYSVDGNGDGTADPSDFHDCLAATAALLLANGAPGALRQALLSYNSSAAFVDQLLSIAASYGYLDPAGVPAQAVALARSRLGLPYVWGAAGPESFDCSGLTQWVYAQLGISLPRTAQAQYDALVPVGMNALQPGDLVFDEYTYPSSDRVTHVGIYEGGGMVVMATQPGAFVEEVALSDPYWAGHFAGAGRPTTGAAA